MNYHKICKEILTNLNYTPKILLHSCCAPCSSQVITLLTEYFDITILYYNPNIYPKDEYIKRKEEQIKLINEIEHKNKIDIIEPKEEEREQINTNEIINSIDTNNDKFITYKVYKIHENETLESIVIKYHTTIDDLKEYNDLSNLNIGDKIIIPSYE